MHFVISLKMILREGLFSMTKAAISKAYLALIFQGSQLVTMQHRRRTETLPHCGIKGEGRIARDERSIKIEEDKQNPAAKASFSYKTQSLLPQCGRKSPAVFLRQTA